VSQRRDVEARRRRDANLTWTHIGPRYFLKIQLPLSPSKTSMARRHVLSVDLPAQAREGLGSRKGG